jgi:protein involved in polysaccharide export with SLBB domain
MFGKLRAEAEDAGQKTSVTAQPAASTTAREGDFVIRIVGAVNQQGTITFSATEKPTVLDLIARAGGFAPRADRRSIRVVSAGRDGMRTNRTLSEEDVLEGFSPEARLFAGDVVVVSERPMSPGEVSVVGAVNNPGVVALPEDGRMSLATAIAKAGGPTRVGNLGQVRVVRMENGEKKTYNINMTGLQRDGAGSSEEWLNFGLKPGDMIFLPERIL